MALLLFCITSISAPTIPEVGAGVGGAVSCPSDTSEKDTVEFRTFNLFLFLKKPGKSAEDLNIKTNSS